MFNVPLWTPLLDSLRHHILEFLPPHLPTTCPSTLFTVVIVDAVDYLRITLCSLFESKWAQAVDKEPGNGSGAQNEIFTICLQFLWGSFALFLLKSRYIYIFRNISFCFCIKSLRHATFEKLITLCMCDN